MTTAAMSSLSTRPDLLRGYADAQAGGYDELLTPAGQIRAHWRPLIKGLSALTPMDREVRALRLDRRVRETGIAYDIFSDPTQASQRWQLDLAPVVFSNAEWRWLETALVQRARLFDGMLADIYGPQRLLREGRIPPELAFSDSAFLRPCQDILPNAGGLRFYAADLARGADGQWRVIDSHTETLAGVGFALANRMVYTHVAGDLFNDVNAVRLASYFQNFQDALADHAGRSSATIALLTPGPHHEDYFSHAYLARYLGYLLVEGADLRTRGKQVYLKTLEGLKEIDIIIRCVDGRSSDPLELDPSGYDGPAGLLRTCRATPKLVANAIGTALVQNRGLGGYLPQLAKDVLGEDLKVFDAPRWWLGDPVARRHVLANIDSMVIRKAQEGTGRPGQAALGQDPRQMSEAERELLRREVGLHGARLVAEEQIGFSTAPVVERGGLRPRPFALRMFVAKTADGYRAMPGGLAMSVDQDRAVALTAPDGQTRDVWVLAEAEQAHHVSLWRPTVAAARVQRSQRVLQSRVADDLFWLGRYAERADWIMRVLRAGLRRLAEDRSPPADLQVVRKCLEVLLTDEDSDEADRRRAASLEFEALCGQLIRGRDAPRSLGRTCQRLYNDAHLVRDRLSLDAWHTLSRFRPGDTWASQLASAGPLSVLDLLEEGLASIAAFNGLMHENMTRNYGWSVLDMGRRIERAYNLSEAMLSLFVPRPEGETEASSLQLILELADSFITYRSRYRLDPMLALVLDLLLLDETNPRSLAFQLEAVSRELKGLPDGKASVSVSEDRRLIRALMAGVQLADVEVLAGADGEAKLEALLREQRELLPELSNAITRHYFNLTDETQHRAHLRAEAP